MNSSNLLSRQGQRLLQIGVALFLATSLEGFIIPYLASPMLGRSTHSLCALFGVMLVALGLAWPRLKLGSTGSQTAFWLLVYSGLAIIIAFLLAAIWGAGNSTMPLAAGPADGSALQVIKVVAYSSAPTGIVSTAMILGGFAS